MDNFKLSSLNLTAVDVCLCWSVCEQTNTACVFTQGLPPTGMPPPTGAPGHGSATISSPAVPNPAIAAVAAPQPANCNETAGGPQVAALLRL